MTARPLGPVRYRWSGAAGCAALGRVPPLHITRVFIDGAAFQPRSIPPERRGWLRFWGGSQNHHFQYTTRRTGCPPFFTEKRKKLKFIGAFYEKPLSVTGCAPLYKFSTIPSHPCSFQRSAALQSADHLVGGMAVKEWLPTGRYICAYFSKSPSSIRGIISRCSATTNS